MGEIKPLGSEKLQGDTKLQRILELTYYKPEYGGTKHAEVVKESTSGVYGIVKEKDGYYVKKGLNENSLDYIGGLYMKNKNKFPSYGEAYKKMEFLIEQEKLQLLTEATKYVLKQPTTQKEAPIPAPTTDASSDTSGNIGTNAGDLGGVPPEDGSIPPPEGELGGDKASSDVGEGDFIKAIQKMTGRLTEKLGEHKDEIQSEDIKYVINMVLGAVPLEKLEDSDMEEIISQLEGGESGEGEEDFPSDETADNPEDSLGSKEPTPAPPENSDELGETMDTLDNLVNTQYDFNEENVDFLEPGSSDEFSGNEPVAVPDTEVSGRVDFSDIDPEGEDIVDPEEVMSPEEKEKLTTGDGGMSLNEEDPFNEGDVKEIDINELTNAVHQGVKETLSKYFSQ